MQTRSEYRLSRASSVLSARGLTKSFARGLARAARRTVAIENVDIDLRSGEVLGIAGSEGSGKTTLLQCLSGLLRRDRGILELCGEPFNGGACSPQVSYVPAVPVFYPFLTVRDVLEFRLARTAYSRCRTECVNRVLSRLELHGSSKCRIAVLPRDMMIRVAVAEALLGDPGVILMDTAPASESDDSAITLAALRAYASEGAAVAIASRDAIVLASAASRVLFLEQGRIRHAFTRDSMTAAAEDPAPEPSVSRLVAETMH